MSVRSSAHAKLWRAWWVRATSFSGGAGATSESWAMSWRKKSSLSWLSELPGVRQGEPLASRTSFGIGGPAEFFIESANPKSIETALEGCRMRGVPYLLLGAGTNLLIADAGVEGLVVRV